MFSSLRHFEAFYKTQEGALVQSVLTHLMKESFKGTKNAIGIGYVSPYMTTSLSIVPASIVIPDETRHSRLNIVHADTPALPLESNSLECVVMIHGLEYCQDPLESMKDIWRVLKSEGQLILIVPNRTGLWAHTEWSPFGHGQPFSQTQIRTLLAETNFVCEELKGALFTPPLRRWSLSKASPFFEKYGRFFMPKIGGVNIAVARKQIYAPIRPSKGTAVPVAPSKLKPTLSKSPYKQK